MSFIKNFSTKRQPGKVEYRRFFFPSVITLLYIVYVLFSDFLGTKSALSVWFSVLGGTFAAGLYRYYINRSFSFRWKGLEFLLPLLLIIESLIHFFGKPLFHLLYIPLTVVVSGFFSFRLVASCILAVLIAGIPSFWKVIYNPAGSNNDAQYGHFMFDNELLNWLYPLIFFTGIISYYIFSREIKKSRQAVSALETLKSSAMNLEVSTERSPFNQDRFSHLVKSVLEIKIELSAMLNLTKKVTAAGSIFLFTIEGNDITLKASTEDMIPELSPDDKNYISGIIKGKKAVFQTGLKGGITGLSRFHPEETKSFLCVPVLDGDIPLGALVMYSNKMSAFNEGEKDMAVEFAFQVKQILKRTRMYIEVERYTRGFKALHEASKTLSMSLEVEKIAEVLVEIVSGMVSSSAVGFLIADKGQLRIIARKGFEPEKSAFYPKGTYFNLIIKNKQLLHLSNLDKKRDVYPFKAGDARTFLGIPIISGEEVLGVLAITSTEPEAISSFQAHLITVIADQATMSIINAQLHKQVEMLAITDGLTELYNHKHFQERLDEEFQRIQRIPQKISLMLLDIDHFKKINDTYGHPAGDIVLKKVAQILKKTLRGIDIIARYGGEEFAVVLNGTERSGAKKMAERLRLSVMNNPFSADGNQILVTLSIGLTTYPDDATVKEELISKADQALYHAKENGRNQVCVWREIAKK